MYFLAVLLKHCWETCIHKVEIFQFVKRNVFHSCCLLNIKDSVGETTVVNCTNFQLLFFGWWSDAFFYKLQLLFPSFISLVRFLRSDPALHRNLRAMISVVDVFQVEIKRWQAHLRKRKRNEHNYRCSDARLFLNMLWSLVYTLCHFPSFCFLHSSSLLPITHCWTIYASQ